MVGVDEASERLSGVVSGLFRGHLAIVIRDVLAVIFSTGDEGWVEEGSGLGVCGERTVHLRMF